MAPGTDLERLHRRYVEQASWTRALRQRFLPPAELLPAMRILEIGAGTGAVIGPMDAESPKTGFSALDLDLEVTRFGAARFPAVRWQVGDALALPLADGCMDAAFFHFVLLWLEHPARALGEAVRVTRPGGLVAAFAEPDHAARIDYPADLAPWGARQTEALKAEGADVALGRRLPSLFAAAGLRAITSGIVGAEWLPGHEADGSKVERETMRSDLEGSVSTADLERWERLDREAWARGERVLFVPTFFAVGRVPSAR